MTWLTVVEPDSGEVHASPQGDAVSHTFEDCVCGPTTEPVEREDGSMGWMHTHHSPTTEETGT